MIDYPWNVLEIDPTQDEAVIRRAYAIRLRQFRPDEDPQGFQRLREARDVAIEWSAFNAAKPATTAEAFQRETISVHSAPVIDTAAQVEATTLSSLMQQFEQLTREQHWQADGIILEWTEAQWRTFMGRASDLGITARQQLRAGLAMRLFPLLPENPEGEADDAFRSIIEIVARLENEFALSAQQAYLLKFIPVKSVVAYDTWLRFVRRRDAMRERVKQGDSAYLDSRGKLSLPVEDHVLLDPNSYLGFEMITRSIPAKWWFSETLIVLLLALGLYHASIKSFLGAPAGPWGYLGTVVVVGAVYALYRLRNPAAMRPIIPLLFPTHACLGYQQPRLATGMALLSITLIGIAFAPSLFLPAIIAVCAANIAARLGLAVMLPRHARRAVVRKAMMVDRQDLLMPRDRARAFAFKPRRWAMRWASLVDLVACAVLIFVLLRR